MAVGSQTLAVTDRDGRRLRKWPLVHRPWPILTGAETVAVGAQTLAGTDRRRRGRDSGDILGGYRV